jgi:hypothetical protein
MPLYGPAVSLLSLYYTARARRVDLWLDVLRLFVTTHLAYGVGEIFGALRPPNAKTAARHRARVGLVVLKNAGNLGDEAIFVSVCRRLVEHYRGRVDAPSFYVVAIGPSGGTFFTSA